MSSNSHCVIVRAYVRYVAPDYKHLSCYPEYTIHKGWRTSDPMPESAVASWLDKYRKDDTLINYELWEQRSWHDA